MPLHSSLGNRQFAVSDTSREMWSESKCEPRIPPQSLTRNRFSSLLITLLVLMLIPASAESVEGFVTELHSASNFKVGAQQVTLDGRSRCATETMDSVINLKSNTYRGLLAHRYFAISSTPIERSIIPTPCQHIALEVGARVRVIADAGLGNGALVASQLTVYDVHIRQNFATQIAHAEWQGGALFEESPDVLRSTKGWSGTFWLDGYPMSIETDTLLLTAPAGTAMTYRQFGVLGGVRFGAALSGEATPPLSRVGFGANMWATYRAAGIVDGRVLATRVRLWPNEIVAKERAYREQVDPVVNPPDYGNRLPGVVEFKRSHSRKTLAVVPDQRVQDWVKEVGRTLIPDYQKGLHTSSPTGY